MIYHFTSQPEWDAAQKAGFYLPRGFENEGFIHCSDHYQLTTTANKLFSEKDHPLCLEINPDILETEVVYENLEGGEMLFPHLYQPLPVSAVETTFAMVRDSKNRWILPDEQLHENDVFFVEMPIDTPGKLYRSPMPGSYQFDSHHEVFTWLMEAQIDVVAVLCSEEEIRYNNGGHLLDMYTLAGIQVIFAPCEDFNTPEPGQWDDALEASMAVLMGGKNLLVHCHAGLGRTGMFLACLAQDILGLTAEEAIDWTRRYIPWAIETHLQKQFVRDYKKF